MNKKGLNCILVTGWLLLAPSSALANHAWDGYHWARTSNPFAINLSDQVDARWDGHLVTASADWTASSVLDAPVIADPCGTRTKGNPHQGATGCVTVQNGSYGRTGWLGLASILFDTATHHILSGAVRVNDTYLFDQSRKARYNDPDARQHVMCQEIGHTLGLDHQFTNAGSCMDYAGLTDPAYVHPNQHDYDELEIIYTHLDVGRRGSSAAIERVTWTTPAAGQFSPGRRPGSRSRRVGSRYQIGT